MPKNNSADLIEKFESRYELGKSGFKAVEDKFAGLRNIEQFSFTVPSKAEAQKRNYVEEIGYLVEEYIKSRLKFHATSRLEGIDVAVKAMVHDYEEILQARHDEQYPDGNVTRQPYSGAHGLIMDTLARKVAPYNLNKANFLKKGILNNLIELDSARKRTQGIFDDTKNMKAAELATRQGVEDLVIMRETMQQVVDGRSRLWKLWFWNWKRNSQEKQYLKELNTQVEAYKSKNLNINAIIQKYSAPIFGEDFAQSIIEEKTAYAQQAKTMSVNENERSKVDGIELNGNKPSNSKAPARKIAVAESVFKMVEEAGDMLAYADQIAETLPNSMNTKKTWALRTKLRMKLLDPIQNFNMAFDKHPENGREVMKQTVEGLYKNAMELTEMAGYEEKHEQIAVAQIILDKVLQKYSPAGFYQKEYGEFASGYIFNHVQEMNSKLPSNFKFTEEDYQKANKLYLELVPEKFPVDELDNGPKDVVPPVKSSAQTKENILDKV